MEEGRKGRRKRMKLGKMGLWLYGEDYEGWWLPNGHSFRALVNSSQGPSVQFLVTAGLVPRPSLG